MFEGKTSLTSVALIVIQYPRVGNKRLSLILQDFRIFPSIVGSTLLSYLKKKRILYSNEKKWFKEASKDKKLLYRCKS